MKIYQQSGQALRLDMGAGVKDSTQPLLPFSPFPQPHKSILLQRNNQSDDKTTELYFSTVYPTNLQKLCVLAFESGLHYFLVIKMLKVHITSHCAQYTVSLEKKTL